MKTTKEQVIELLETEINEVETGHEVYSRNETARVLAGILGKVKDIPVEEMTLTEKIDEYIDDLKQSIEETVDNFSFDLSYDLRNGNEIEGEVDNATDLFREIESDIDKFAKNLKGERD
jgi:hypothetical protein